MMQICFIIAFSVFSAFPLFAATPQETIAQFIKESKYADTAVGIVIKEVGASSVLVSINRNKKYNPASVMKLVTGTAAFDLLGMDYCFKTDVYLERPFRRDSAVVKGDMYVRGGGDPGLYAERLWLFVQHLIHQGIKKIEGNLILDDSFFDLNFSGPGFNENGSSRAYEAQVAALSANFNTVAVHVAPGETVGAPIYITPFPRMMGVKIISTAKTSRAGSPAQLKIKTEEMDGKTAILVYGNMGIDEEPRYRYRKVYNTWENFGWVLHGFFEENGIEFLGTVKHMATPDSLRKKEPFYTFTSRPLPECVFSMFKYSSNFAAEMLFKTIAAENDSLPGSWKSGAQKVKAWWKKKRLSRGKKKIYPQIKNGSGMGGGNQLSPSHVTTLLEYVWKKRTFTPEFVYALSIAGVDGTLKDRFKKSHLKGLVRAKTGTLNDRGVSNLAGYVFYRKKIYAFAILVNYKEKTQFSHWTIQQKILEKVFPRPYKKKKAKKR